MTIDELITLAEEARETLAGDAQVRIATQPGYPVRAALQHVPTPFSADPAELYAPVETAPGRAGDGTFLWLAVGDVPDGENPYAPGGPGSVPASPDPHLPRPVITRPGEVPLTWCF